MRLAYLRDPWALTALDLGGTKITNGGLVLLSALFNLAELDRCETEISDEGLVHLRRLPDPAVIRR